MSIATLGSNLDSESKLCSEEPEWVLKSLLTTHHPPTHPPGSWIFFYSESMVGGSGRVLEGPGGLEGSSRVLEGPEGLGGFSRVLEGVGGSVRVQ